jgi:hypothetical protein
VNQQVSEYIYTQVDTDGYLSVILKTMNEGHPLFWWVFGGDKHARALFGACFSCFLAHVFQPIKLCLVHVSLVFLHMFFWWCSTVLHVLSVQEKNMAMLVLELF